MNRNRPRHVSPTVIIIAATLLVFSVVNVITRLMKVNPANDWDILIFSQNWPLSVCHKWHDRINGSCTYPNDKTLWTIHGIWPTKIGTKGPLFCNKSRPFNIEEIYGLLPELNSRWTPVENHQNNNSFWRHEWEKHGTCAAVLPSLSNEFKFFEQGLTWSKEFNVKNIFEKRGILPRAQPYNSHDLWNTIKDITGRNPRISCYTSHGISYLYEVQICFDKRFSLIHCDGSSVNADLIACPRGKDVYYLGTDSPHPDKYYIPVDHPLITVLKSVQLLQWITW